MNVVRLSNEKLPDHVAAALGWRLDASADGSMWHGQDGPVCLRSRWRPHEDWRQGGPIVEEYWLDITGTLEVWYGRDWREQIVREPGGVLCNMMRAFVDAMLGGLPA